MGTGAGRAATCTRTSIALKWTLGNSAVSICYSFIHFSLSLAFCNPNRLSSLKVSTFAFAIRNRPTCFSGLELWFRFRFLKSDVSRSTWRPNFCFPRFKDVQKGLGFGRTRGGDARCDAMPNIVFRRQTIIVCVFRRGTSLPEGR